MASEAFRTWYENMRDTGDISPLRLGVTTPKQITDLFGQPDQTVAERRGKEPPTLVYDGLEFSFASKHGNTLFGLLFMNEYEVSEVAILRVPRGKGKAVTMCPPST